MTGETGSVKGETISANFSQGKCKFIANFSATMVTSLVTSPRRERREV